MIVDEYGATWKKVTDKENYKLPEGMDPEKVKWMGEWCKKEGINLLLSTTLGVGRNNGCVGIAVGSFFLDYKWYEILEDEKGDEYESDIRADSNGDVWKPEKACPFPDCTCVMGTGKDSLEQLYEWIQYFDKNNFHYTRVPTEGDFDEEERQKGYDALHLLVKR